MGTLQETFGIGSALDAAAAEWYAKRYDHGDNYQSSRTYPPRRHRWCIWF